MSSASSGRYQSRLFNFVHRQSRKLTQGCDRAFRHLQVATNAVVPVLLYPIYLLFQSTAAKQLHQAAPQSWTQLPVDNPNSLHKPSSDTPIQRVLQAVVPAESAILTFPQDKKPAFSALLTFLRFKFFPSGLDSTSNFGHSSPQITSLPISPVSDPPCPVIQGIATQLASRTLVLVTAQNKILDIFTPQQQQKLQERIIAEVADYWRYQQLSGKQQPQQLVSTRAIFLPVSLSSMKARVQEAVARNSNIFPKSSLVRNHGTEGNLHPLVFLDRTVAALESKHLVPLLQVTLTVRQRSWELVQLGQTQLIIFLFGIHPTSTTLASATLLDSETHTSRIKTLIFAAINYFFGDGFADSRSNLRVRQPKVTTMATTASLKPSTTQTKLNKRTFKLPTPAQSVIDDPWLTSNDLFGTDFAADSIYEPPSQTTNQLPGTTLVFSSQAVKYFPRNLANRFQTLPQSQQKTTKGKIGIRSKQVPPLSKSPLGVNSGVSNHSHRSKTDIEPQPDWIETNATAIGYVLHPLEQLLAWLDRVMLWLEEILIKTFQWVQRLWRGK